MLWRALARTARGLLVCVALAAPRIVLAQAQAPAEQTPAHRPAPWRRFALGGVTSILAHEGGHALAAFAMGSHPYYRLSKGRPTIYPGFPHDVAPEKQFVFSAAGMTVQLLMDEAILDVPHRRGSAFERGLLAGGIATVAFYATLGRNSRVSDITLMAENSNLGKTEVSLIFAAVAALHVVRIGHDGHYAHFFALPRTDAHAMRVGVFLPAP